MMMHLIERNLKSADVGDLEISLRLILGELRKRTHPRITSVSYDYAAGILNDNHTDDDISPRLIKFAFENVGMQMACVVYKFFAPCRLNPETTIESMAKRKGWKEYANQDSVELSE
jgi:hypothetical protein